MLERRGQLPHFTVTTVDGTRFSYADIWQSRNLVLVALPMSASNLDRAYVEALGSELELSNPTGQHTALVITREHLPGDAQPLALVADKWGEIYYVTHADHLEGLPSPTELGQWLLYVRSRCG